MHHHTTGTAANAVEHRVRGAAPRAAGGGCSHDVPIGFGSNKRSDKSMAHAACRMVLA